METNSALILVLANSTLRQLATMAGSPARAKALALAQEIMACNLGPATRAAYQAIALGHRPFWFEGAIATLALAAGGTVLAGQSIRDKAFAAMVTEANPTVPAFYSDRVSAEGFQGWLRGFRATLDRVTVDGLGRLAS
jgi:hypothetical protein